MELTLWLVPTLTNEILHRGPTLSNKKVALPDGCYLIGFALVPLYPLLAGKGEFNGNVSWNLSLADNRETVKNAASWWDFIFVFGTDSGRWQ
jgi:hypothetical protein